MGSTGALHIGQCCLTWYQISKQFSWKVCPHTRVWRWVAKISVSRQIEHFTSSSSEGGGTVHSAWLSLFEVFLRVPFVRAEIFGSGIFLDLHLFSVAAAIWRVELVQFLHRRRTAGDGEINVDEDLAAVNLKLYTLFIRIEALLVSIFFKMLRWKNKLKFTKLKLLKL